VSDKLDHGAHVFDMEKPDIDGDVCVNFQCGDYNYLNRNDAIILAKLFNLTEADLK
jgi:hypothetical protein